MEAVLPGEVGDGCFEERHHASKHLREGRGLYRNKVSISNFLAMKFTVDYY